MQSTALLRSLCRINAISGYEKPVREFMRQHLGDADRTEQDRAGNILFHYTPRGKSLDSAPKIMLLAHMDEVGFIVSDILDNGFLRMQNIGGWSPVTAVSSGLRFMTGKDQDVFGVFGSIPPHYRDNAESLRDFGKLYADVGATSKKDVLERFGIEVGTPVVPVGLDVHDEERGLLFAKALDDRVGVGSVIELGLKLAETDHPNHIVCGGSVQEEVGVRGASIIRHKTDADVCFVIDTPPADDTPGMESSPKNACGKGVHLRLYDPGLLVPPGLARFVKTIAEEHNIPVQPVVRRSGGTDAREIHLGAGGIPTIVLGIPVRYAHTPTGLIHTSDYLHLVSLLQHLVQKLDHHALETILNG